MVFDTESWVVLVTAPLGRRNHRCGAAASSGALSVEVLQQLVRCELDLHVPPLRGAVVAGDQPIRCRRRRSPSTNA